MIFHTAGRLEPHPAPGGGTRLFARDVAPEELLEADRVWILREGKELRLTRESGGAWRAAVGDRSAPADRELILKSLELLLEFDVDIEGAVSET